MSISAALHRSLAFAWLGPLAVCLTLGCTLLQWPAAAPIAWCQEAADEADSIPLYEEEPYDEIVLNDEEQTVVPVLPVDLPDRKEPDRDTLKKTDKLIVKKLDDPTQDYEILWTDIAAVRFFEQMILDKALELVRAGKGDPKKFDEAYLYFDFLKHEWPKTHDLDAGLAEYLYEDARHWHNEKKYENALALLDELYLLAPQYPRLEAGLGAASQKIAEQDVAGDDYPAARGRLARLQRKYPKHAAVAKLEQQWADTAREALAQAKAKVEADQPRDAWELGLRAVYVWPKLPAAQQFLQDLYQRYPRVVVGVTLPGGKAPADRMLDWAARRRSRLLHRLLLEYAGPGANGGRYECPLGTIEVTDIGRRLALNLRHGIRWSGGQQLTGFDVARRLLALADPRNLDADRDWSDLFGGVEVQDVFNVGVDLRWTHVQPLALLQTPLASSAEGDLAATVGPYALLETKGNDAYFGASDSYFDAQPTQPREVIERYFEDSNVAFEALRQGQIQALDRLSPWQVEKFQAEPAIVVEQYVLPSIHCLLPNRTRPFTGHRSFRRALTFAIDREAILEEQLLRGADRPGCQVVSGPFPIGSGFDDPLRYAYNSDVAVRPRNRRLALALSGVALHDVSAAAEANGGAEIKAIPPLSLAYPAHETARIACLTIQRHLKASQIEVKLRELPPGQAVPPDGDYDLLYAELVVQEPLVDAARLLGPNGLAGGATPYMVLALRELNGATGWAAARKKLQQIHRLADDDTAVIPLWQLTEFFAYHRSLEGLRPKPVMFYQDVEHWQGKFQLPAEGP
ncbi:MAG TPA: ABC transporter substrate-binding protein [Pirellulales bacterium]|nr:ABC transporter substrate-binding protein [Pirellulales bacterium]